MKAETYTISEYKKVTDMFIRGCEYKEIAAETGLSWEVLKQLKVVWNQYKRQMRVKWGEPISVERV